MLENDSAVYKTLLESTKAIPWKIDWNSMQFTYIGPQIENLLGWAQSSWRTVDDWASRMHPDDRERVVNFCVAQSKEGVDHEADYRAETSDGRYVWIRDVVHVVRDQTGQVESLVGFMFDIEERKRTEERLAALQKELEELSFKDGLTNVANRRMFDTVLNREWNSAQRTGQPLSLVLLDIDHFKQFNDLYGHVRGDECLKTIARALSAVTMRGRDLLARFGGEEFALIMPDTDAQSARMLAQRCRDLIVNEKIKHEVTKPDGVLTISVGAGTIVPDLQATPTAFLDEVDKRLYRAKMAGRNCIVDDRGVSFATRPQFASGC